MNSILVLMKTRKVSFMVVGRVSKLAEFDNTFCWECYKESWNFALACSLHLSVYVTLCFY